MYVSITYIYINTKRFIIGIGTHYHDTGTYEFHKISHRLDLEDDNESPGAAG